MFKLSFLCRIGLHKLRIVDSKFIDGKPLCLVWECERCGGKTNDFVMRS